MYSCTTLHTVVLCCHVLSCALLCTVVPRYTLLYCAAMCCVVFCYVQLYQVYHCYTVLSCVKFYYVQPYRDRDIQFVFYLETDALAGHTMYEKLENLYSASPHALLNFPFFVWPVSASILKQNAPISL